MKLFASLHAILILKPEINAIAMDMGKDLVKYINENSKANSEKYSVIF